MLETPTAIDCAELRRWQDSREETEVLYMRLIHCADVHLDSPMTSHFDRELARKRKSEILYTFKRVLDYAASNEVDAVLISGDLFDSELVTGRTVSKVAAEIKGHSQVEVYCLAGNHDRGRDVWSGFELPENLHLFDDEWTYYHLGDITIAGVNIFSYNADGIYDALELNEDDFNIVMLHGQVRTGKKRAGVDDIFIDRLRDKNIDYLALGHVHERSYDRLDMRGVYCYPGCLEGRGFDECGEHGFVMIDVDENRLRSSFVPFAYRRLEKIEVDVTDATDNVEIADAIADRLYEATRESAAGGRAFSRKDMVRVVLVGETDVENDIDTGYLKSQFEDSLYYIDIKDCTRLRVDYMRYANDASLKGEFIRIVMAQDIEAGDKAQIIRIGLRALAGEEIWQDGGEAGL